MFVYIGIYFFSIMFSFFYTKAKDKFIRIVLLLLTFLTLFLPSSLRYGIGMDYISYTRIYNSILNNKTIDIEPAIYLISNILQFFTLPSHSLFVAYAFLTILFIFLAIPKKYFCVGIISFVLMNYLDSYCLLRQSLAISVFLYALKFYFSKKNIKFIFWVICACLCHKVVFIFLFVLLCSKFIPPISHKFHIINFILWEIFLLLFSSIVVNIVMGLIVPLTPFKNYTINKYSAMSVEVSSGLGSLLKIGCLFLFTVLVTKQDCKKSLYNYCVILIFYLVFVINIRKHLYIIVRAENSFAFAYILLAIVSCKNSTNKYRKLILCFLFISYSLLFFKGITNSSIAPIDKSKGSGKQIYPYLSIWTYQNNPVVLSRLKAAGLNF